MKILFVDPVGNRSPKVRASRVKMPDIGIAYISSALKKKGHSTDFIESGIKGLSVSEVSAQIAEFKPDVVGIPVFTPWVEGAAAVADTTKKYSSSVKVVIGGAHPTAVPEEALAEIAGADFAVMWEGERSTLRLIETLENGSGDYENIPSLAWRSGPDYDVIVNGPPNSDADPNELEFPDWSIFSLDCYSPLYSGTGVARELPVISARGCRGRCAFCFRLGGDRVRPRAVESVIEEIERNVAEFGADGIVFYDEAFTVDRERARTICEAIMNAGLNKKISWVCETRVDMADRETFVALKKAGCTHISFGVESGSAEVLKKNNKGTKPEQALNAIRIAKEAGLVTDANYILGLPYDSAATVHATKKFSLRADSNLASYFIFVPFPGTKAAELIENDDSNIRRVDAEWGKFEPRTGGAVEMKDFPIKKLERFQLMCYLHFYLRPRKLRMLFRMVGPGRLFEAFMKLLTGKW